jgi:hypothetical protein
MDDDISSIGDVSVITDMKVFNPQKAFKQHSNNLNKGKKNKLSNAEKSSNNSKENSNISSKFIVPKLSLKEKDMKHLNPEISFRTNDKLDKNLNTLRRETETIDNEMLTNIIIEKVGKLKSRPTDKLAFPDSKIESNETLKIAQVFLKKDNSIENEKEFEFGITIGEYDEKDETENDTVRQNNKEDSENIFWNLKQSVENGRESLNSKRAKSAYERKLDFIDDESSFKSSSKSKKLKKDNFVLNTIVCTLSRIENGSAIFVSSEDNIFVLPSLFVPRNLTVGNIYTFDISEGGKFVDRAKNISNIHRKYLKTNASMINNK